MFADGNFSARPNEALPVVGVGLQVAREEDFDASAKKVARGRILRAESLRLKTSAPAIQTRGKHSSVVEDNEVTGTEKLREFPELTIYKSAACRGKMQKPRCR